MPLNNNIVHCVFYMGIIKIKVFLLFLLSTKTYILEPIDWQKLQISISAKEGIWE